MTNFLKSLLCSLLLILISCESKNEQLTSSDYMVFDNIEYIAAFPKTIELDNAQLIHREIPGALSIKVIDSLIIVSTNNNKGFWSIFSLPSFEFRGQFIHQGNGPIEVISTPWVIDQSFYKRNGKLHSIIYDFSTGKLLDFNITETLHSDSIVINKCDVNLNKSLFNFNVVDNSTFFCTSVDNTHTQQKRLLLSNNIELITESMERLNNAKIEKGGDINAIGSITIYDSTTKHIAECGVMLNQINLYSIENDFAATKCFGKKIDKISDIPNRNGKRAYMALFGYQKFFTALYYNLVENEVEIINPSLQFFDWYGKPLLEVKLKKPLTTTSIDFNNKTMYGSDYRTEEIYKYDISDILDYLESVNVL